MLKSKRTAKKRERKRDRRIRCAVAVLTGELAKIEAEGHTERKLSAAKLKQRTRISRIKANAERRINAAVAERSQRPEFVS
jgi:hypothetical protein